MEHHTLGCVIFDLDGTLLDSMNVWSQIDRNLLNHYGKTAPDDLTEQVKKMTIQQSAQYFSSMGRMLLSDSDTKNRTFFVRAAVCGC